MPGCVAEVEGGAAVAALTAGNTLAGLLGAGAMFADGVSATAVATASRAEFLAASRKRLDSSSKYFW